MHIQTPPRNEHLSRKSRFVRWASLLVVAVVIFGLLGLQYVRAREEHRAYQKLCAMGATGDDWVGWREIFGSEYRPILEIHLPPSVSLDTALPHLALLDNLESLDLSSHPLRDDDLIKLRQLDRIRSLNLSRTGITDGGIPHLSSMHRLQFLYLEGTSISDEGLQELQRALPQCKIKR